MAQVFSVLSAISAFAAAVLWFLSAVVKTPDTFSIDVTLLGPLTGGSRSLEGRSPELTLLAAALKRQSRFSAFAAVGASLSAAFQVIAFLF